MALNQGHRTVESAPWRGVCRRSGWGRSSREIPTTPGGLSGDRRRGARMLLSAAGAGD